MTDEEHQRLEEIREQIGRWGKYAEISQTDARWLLDLVERQDALITRLQSAWPVVDEMDRISAEATRDQ